MKIKELLDKHPRIYELAILRQKEAGNEANDELEVHCGTEIGNFDWDKTIEDWDFWSKIDSSNFDVFYQKYPHANDLPLINPEMLEVKEPDVTEHIINGASVLVHKDFEKEMSKGILEGAREYLEKNLTKDPINKAWQEKFVRPVPQMQPLPTEIKTPEYYDNSKGSLYKFATDRNWNAYLFDVVKRLERGGKKDPLKNEIEKSIAVLQLWLKEL